MVELYKLALKKPLEALVLVLCVGLFAFHIGLYEVRQAVAVIDTRLVAQDAINLKVGNVSESLIRIEENVRFNKEVLSQLRIKMEKEQ